MSKRQTDTDKWEKRFMRTLPSKYKLLWLYVCDKCDHAGIWHVNLDMASMLLNEEINEEEALGHFGDRVIQFDDGEKWFLPGFVDFQYAEDLQEDNRVHKSVIQRLKRYGLWIEGEGIIRDDDSKNKTHIRALEGPKEKEKEKEKEKTKEKEGRFESFWKAYPKKYSKGQAEKVWRRLKPSEQLIAKILQAVERAKTSEKWRKDSGQFIPYPATWLNAKGWEDEVEEDGLSAFRREAEEEAREQKRVP